MKRCMIVDDSSVIRKVAKRILSSPQLLVSEASSATEAIYMCEADMPDVIMLDATLPDMDTVDFIRQAMTIESKVKPQVVISLTQFDIGTIMRAKRAGAKGYILKPFNRQLLIDRFRSMDLLEPAEAS
ncbi:MAG: response regulator [Rhizobiaceae bacterium]|nr:response regulator [Rhizobiaceae bacterium]MCC0043839.1 response regulator [Brucellaceae bacterium]